MRVKNPDDVLVLVNKERWLSKEYIPLDLVVPKVNFLPDTNPEAMFFRKKASKSLEKLFKKAKKENFELYAVSGYRSYRRQSEIFKSNLRRDGEAANRYSARPGQSEHQTGLAMDITSKNVDFLLCEEFGDTDEYRWLSENVHKFGFIIRYPRGAEEITGYNFEPWHLRYVGEDVATEIFLRGIVLEEYIK